MRIVFGPETRLSLGDGARQGKASLPARAGALGISTLSAYQGPMPARLPSRPPVLRARAALALLALGVALSGCAEMSDSMTSAFADPAKYDLYECKQLEPERKTLANRAAELQGLMAKAETGVGGAVVAELAYRNDYIAVRGQSKLAEEAWRKNRCHEAKPEVKLEPPVVAPAPVVRGARTSKSGSAVH